MGRPKLNNSAVQRIGCSSLGGPPPRSSAAAFASAVLPLVLADFVDGHDAAVLQLRRGPRLLKSDRSSRGPNVSELGSVNGPVGLVQL